MESECCFLKHSVQGVSADLRGSGLFYPIPEYMILLEANPVSWKLNSGGAILQTFLLVLLTPWVGFWQINSKQPHKSIAESETDGTLQICLNFLISAVITNVFCSVTLCTQTDFEHMKTWLSSSPSSQKLCSCAQEQMLWGSLRNRRYGMTVSQQLFLNVGNQKQGCFWNCQDPLFNCRPILCEFT